MKFRSFCSCAIALCILAASFVLYPTKLTNALGTEIDNTSIYGLWGGDYGIPIHSHLEYTSDGRYMLFTADDNKDYKAEYFDESYNPISTKTIPMELPRYGAFYSDGSYYYVLSGQNNPDESPDVECFRLTKYDSSWNRISSCGLFDCNTTQPFSFGSADIASSGDYIVIRSCHIMYTSSDGVRHQANVTIYVEKNSMTITDHATDVSWKGGYVSHSFKQLVEIEDGRVIAADHGDAYPRAIVLQTSPNVVSEGIGNSWPCTHVLNILGAPGTNTTFAELAGLAISDSSYLVTGSSIEQELWESNDIQSLKNYPRNAFLSIVDKNSNTSTLKWISDDPQSIAEGPYLVKVNSNRFAIIWSNYNYDVCYRFYDGAGNELSGVYSYGAGALNCTEPVLINGKITWTVSYNDGSVDFYCIGADNGKFETHEKGVRGFVDRLYSVALGRSADSAGKTNWISELNSGRSTGGDIAIGFLESEEFRNKNLPYDEFVRILYKTFFDREADDYGLNYWVSILNNGGSRRDVINGFIGSNEWATLCWKFGIQSGGAGVPDTHIEPNEQIIGFATRLYTTCLVRDPDPAGLADWADRLANNKVSGSEAAYGFFFSDEFKVSNISNDEYVLRLYHTFMDREPDPAGFADWTGQLAAGASRESVFNGFTGSAEWALICSDYGILK
ncbi:MAG: DUF4214 domain-containing protein [Clostridiales bacterium]|nr:DUF4214 domain-containing protein [Clostridiales bacterium]